MYVYVCACMFCTYACHTYVFNTIYTVQCVATLPFTKELYEPNCSNPLVWYICTCMLLNSRDQHDMPLFAPASQYA